MEQFKLKMIYVLKGSEKLVALSFGHTFNRVWEKKSLENMNIPNIFNKLFQIY